MSLTAKTLTLIKKYAAGMARANGEEDASRYFSLTPLKETQLRDALLQESEFLRLIKVIDVQQVNGQVLSTGTPGLYCGRKKDGRFLRPIGVDGNDYQLFETDSGSSLPYSLMASWANSGSEDEFFQRIQSFSNESFALDMLRIAFNGIRADEYTDPDANPNGEDVNIGWHQIVKTRSPLQVEGGEYTIGGTNADFIGLDAAVSHLIHSLIDEPYRNYPCLVVLVSADLIAADAISMMNIVDRPTEKVAVQSICRQIAGRMAYSPPFMPDGRLIVTTLENLHIYTQAGTRKRSAEWSDERKCFENSYLRMEGYAVGHDEIYAAFDKLTLATGNSQQFEAAERISI